MTGFLSDHNVEGQVRRLFEVLDSSDYCEMWSTLGLKIEFFHSRSLDPELDDRSVWNHCQEHGLALITANRNHEDDSSLEAAIRDGSETDLPVFTLGDSDRILHDSDYALEAAVTLFEYVLNLEQEPNSVLGTGRLYIPKKPV
jgi:hypothetical protein